MDKKLNKLQEILDEFSPRMKVWTKAVVSLEGEVGSILFTNPKGKNSYSFLLKQFPIQEIDKVIAIYRAKVNNLK